MSQLRSELRAHTQKSYGGYCSMCYRNKIEPVPYHKYSDYVEKGLRTKEIYKLLHN